MAKNKSRSPKIDPPAADPIVDPADVYARVESDAIPPPLDDQNPPPPLDDEAPRKKKSTRAPAVIPQDDDGIDPLDAAAELVALTDGAFNMLCQVRGYAMIMTVVDGETVPVLVLMQPTPEAKERLKKALARVLKSAGATMSPGAGLALAAFGCYGAPVVGLEMARAAHKKAAKAAGA